MPTLTFLRSIPGTDDAMSSNIFANLQDAPILSHSATQIVFSASDSENDLLTIRGTGFTYTMEGSAVVGIPSGTVTSVVYNNPSLGETYLNWTGLSVSANPFVTYVMTSNWSALNALLFGTSDTYNMTNGIDRVRGFGGNDVINGFDGADWLYGDDGRDKLIGGVGSDKLFGGAGGDTLVGGQGIDTLAGGSGSDVFLFTLAKSIHRDILTDFKAIDDSIQVDDAAFKAFSYSGQLHAADFVAGSSAADSADRFIYQKSTGSLWYDADGSGSLAKVLIADLVDGTSLTAADIFII